MGSVVGVRVVRMRTKFWSENPKGRDSLEDLGVNGEYY